MKVALVTPAASIDGGVAGHVQTSAAILRRAGMEVAVLAGDIARDCHDVYVPGITVGLVAPHVSNAIVKATHGYDVVHVHNVDDCELIARLASRAATVISSHGWSGCPSGLRYFGRGRECFRAKGAGCIPSMLGCNCNHRSDPRPVLAQYRAAGTRLAALSAAHLVVAHSTAVAQHLENNGLTNVVVVPLAVSVAASSRSVSGNRVLFSGRLVPAKGVHVLLNACKYFEAPVDVCGDGWARDALERRAARLGLTRRVTFHGWCDASQLIGLYRTAGVAVVPSLWPEPFGLVGPEAMGFSIPVVGSNSGGTRDWLQDNRNGLTVTPGRPEELGRAVDMLLSNDELRTRLGHQAYKDTRHRWSSESHLTALISAYQCAIDRFRQGVR